MCTTVRRWRSVKERIAWVTDSTGFLDEDLKRRDDIFTVPMVVIIDGEEYEDGVTISTDELYSRMGKGAESVTTSQPSAGTFAALYKRLSARFDRIISVHVSGKLSGTVASSRQAADLVDIPVDIFDSEMISFPMILIMKKLIKEIEGGATVAEAFRRAGKYRDSQETYVLIGSLEQLHKSGRLSGLSYIIGSMLKIKPVISITDGMLETKTKARSEQKAEKTIFSRFESAYKTHSMQECCILYGSEPSQAEGWKRLVKLAAPDIRIHAYPLGSAIGVHTGPETIGISWFNENP